AVWLQEVWAARAASAARGELRGKYLAAILKLDAAGRTAEDSTAARHTLANRGLDALDAYFAKYLPQLVFTALVTPIFVLFIWNTDWLSGLILVATMPLIPLFMVMIGWATRNVQQRQLDSLTRLSQHFLEVLRGLITLKIFRREWAQVETMATVGEEYRKRTMKVLSVSFLSGFALELAASLSVALMAVSIGFRLMDGSLALTAGLFVLLLAPEAYLPLRMVGANFHAAAEGVQASVAVLDAIDAAAKVGDARVESVGAVELPLTGKLTVLVGPSGAGKSTQLNRWRSTVGQDQVAWLPQQNSLFSTTVLANIVGPVEAAAVSFDAAKLERAVKLAALDDLSLDVEVGESGSAISGGQRQRIALARAIYRALAHGSAYLLLDEPISAIDAARAGRVVAGLRELASEGFAVCAVSHQDALAEAADIVIEVGDRR
ncbi:MAG: ATP-binding cassette domain-containing protein, partial [Actinomycetales bacterium]|nr:ATP-binding cassette domain-containing protein [Actinomycetales bacterium]